MRFAFIKEKIIKEAGRKIEQAPGKRLEMFVRRKKLSQRDQESSLETKINKFIPYILVH